MSITKDTQSEIVVRKSLWWRVFMWFFTGLATMFFIAGLVQSLGGELGALIMAGIGLLFTLLGISFVRMNTKVNFNKPFGYITVARGNYPSFLWSLRTKVISREEAKSVFVYPVEGGFTDGFGNTTTRTVSYRVTVVMLSGKEIMLHDDGRADVADHLAKRILGFSMGD